MGSKIPMSEASSNQAVTMLGRHMPPGFAILLKRPVRAAVEPAVANLTQRFASIHEGHAERLDMAF